MKVVFFMILKVVIARIRYFGCIAINVKQDESWLRDKYIPAIEIGVSVSISYKNTPTF